MFVRSAFRCYAPLIPLGVWMGTSVASAAGYLIVDPPQNLAHPDAMPAKPSSTNHSTTEQTETLVYQVDAQSGTNAAWRSVARP